MVGGDKTSFDAVKPLLDIIGQNVFHLGENGTGTMHKLTNNILALGATVLLQEVMVMGKKAGFDPKGMHDVWAVSSGRGQAALMPRVLNATGTTPSSASSCRPRTSASASRRRATSTCRCPSRRRSASGTRAASSEAGATRAGSPRCATIEEDADVNVGAWPEEA